MADIQWKSTTKTQILSSTRSARVKQKTAEGQLRVKQETARKDWADLKAL